jgi:hypothetical protein
MPDPIVITHTDLKNFLLCRRRWFFDYVLDYRLPEKVVGALALGSRVHAGLEHYYKGLGDPLERHEELFRADLAALEAADTPPWDIEQLYKDVIVGRNCVAAHQEWLATEGADAGYTIEGVEQTVTAPILDGRVTIVGKVDVLFRRVDSGFLVVNDLKTDGGRPGSREQLERSWQHHIYLIALRLSHPDQFIAEAHYTVIRKLARPSRAKGALVERFRVPGTTRMADTKLRQLEVICTEMLRTMESIQAEGMDHAFPSPNHECQWCPYKQPCEVLDESSDAAQAMLDREFVRGGRHGRYR